MLPKQQRLAPEDFSRIRTQARSVHGDYFFFRLLQSRESISARAGIIIPKKLVARATTRNRFRRQIRSVLQPILPTLPHGTRLLVLLKVKTSTLSFAALKMDIVALLRRARLM